MYQEDRRREGSYSLDTCLWCPVGIRPAELYSLGRSLLSPEDRRPAESYNLDMYRKFRLDTQEKVGLLVGVSRRQCHLE